MARVGGFGCNVILGAHCEADVENQSVLDRGLDEVNRSAWQRKILFMDLVVRKDSVV